MRLGAREEGEGLCSEWCNGGAVGEGVQRGGEMRFEGCNCNVTGVKRGGRGGATRGGQEEA